MSHAQKNGGNEVLTWVHRLTVGASSKETLLHEGKRDCFAFGDFNHDR